MAYIPLENNPLALALLHTALAAARHFIFVFYFILFYFFASFFLWQSCRGLQVSFCYFKKNVLCKNDEPQNWMNAI